MSFSLETTDALELKGVTVQIKLNGVSHDIEDDMSVMDLILNLELDPKNVAVERNLEIIPKSLHSETRIENGDVLEIVEFVGGG